MGEGSPVSLPFTVPKTGSVRMDKTVWRDLFRRRQANKNGDDILPPDWCDIIESFLVEVFPYCSIGFKRHKLYKSKSSLNLAKFWYYGRIAGCNLKGSAVLNSSMALTFTNINTHLKHDRGKRKSFESRPVKGRKRLILGERAADMNYPSKLFHRKLASLDENLFRMGNLKDVPRSKNVITQCAYEYRKSQREDDSLTNSLIILKQKFAKEMGNKIIPGFLQFFTVDPLTVSLWCEADIEFSTKCVNLNLC